EKPTPSLARMMRLERQVSDLMSASVSSMSASERTSMGCPSGGGPGSGVRRDGPRRRPSARRGGRRADGGAGSGGERLVAGGLDDLEALGEELVGDRERGQQLDDLVGGAAGLHQQALLEGACSDLPGDLTAGHLQAAGEAPA